ncbi:MAG: flippase-like domain-containing protein, partial [Ignavibacteriae bacterium]|nr:flippase-like domain-containing protein [Ignavibacteriota bacterium]
MTSRSKTFLKYGFSAFLTVFFLYVTFAKTDLVMLFDSMRAANYWWMMVMFGCMMLSHVLRSWRWRFLLEPIKPKIKLRNLFSGVMVGYLMNNIFPRAGEIVRPYTIGKLESIPKSAAFGTVVVERIIDSASFLLLVLFIPVVYDGPLVETFPMLEEAGILISLVIALLFVLMVTMMMRRDWTDALLGVFNRLLPSRLFQRIDKRVHVVTLLARGHVQGLGTARVMTADARLRDLRPARQPIRRDLVPLIGDVSAALPMTGLT